MSTSDSLDEDELAADSRTRVFPASRAMSSQVVQLTSTLKVVHSNLFCMFFCLFLVYTVFPKLQDMKLIIVTLSNLNGSLKFFH